MNKITSDLLRTALKVGGAVLATIGILPAECGTALVADPTIPAIGGTIVTLAGIAWGVISAQHHQELKEKVGE